MYICIDINYRCITSYYLIITFYKSEPTKGLCLLLALYCIVNNSYCEEQILLSMKCFVNQYFNKANLFKFLRDLHFISTI